MNAPRKAPAHRLEGAPPYVVAVYDDGPRANDRYTVLFGWPLWQPEMGREVPCLHFNKAPTHPAVGVSLWGEVSWRWGAKMISWSDLPEHLQQHVIARVNYPDKILIGRLAMLEGAHKTGRDMWGFEPPEGIGHFDNAFLTKKEARAYAKANNIILLEPRQ